MTVNAAMKPKTAAVSTAAVLTLYSGESLSKQVFFK